MGFMVSMGSMGSWVSWAKFSMGIHGGAESMGTPKAWVWRRP